MLASEILNLKHIVMKLQSYTLDINKTLIQERIQILSDIPNKAGISMIEVADDLNLRDDIANMIGVTTMEETFDMQNEDTTVEETTVEDTTVEEENAATISNEIDETNINENLEIQLCESAR
jgi:Ran GTPase-activating protein (RanGAP) involved in mRNA processing and transport